MLDKPLTLHLTFHAKKIAHIKKTQITYRRMQSLTGKRDRKRAREEKKTSYANVMRFHGHAAK